MKDLTTQAIHFCFCPRCGVRPFIRCRTPKGRVANVHGERIQRLQKQYPKAAAECSTVARVPEFLKAK